MSKFSNQPEKYVVLQGTKFAETDKAVRFYVKAVGGEAIPQSLWKSLWLPLSQIKSMLTAAPGSDDLDEVMVKEWIWKAKIQDDYEGKDPTVLESFETVLDDEDEDTGDYDDPPF